MTQILNVVQLSLFLFKTTVCVCVASHITYYSLVFKDCSDNKYYKASYSFNKHAYEELCFDDVDEYGQVKCIEVKPVEITRIEYQTV